MIMIMIMNFFSPLCAKRQNPKSAPSLPLHFEIEHVANAPHRARAPHSSPNRPHSVRHLCSAYPGWTPARRARFADAHEASSSIVPCRRLTRAHFRACVSAMCVFGASPLTVSVSFWFDTSIAGHRLFLWLTCLPLTRPLNH